MKLLNGSAFRRLEGALHAAELRQEVISNNIANADTPYFKRSEVVFENILDQAMNKGEPGTQLPMKRTHPKHMGLAHSAEAPQAHIVTDQLSVMNNNVNNVDIDREMSLLAKNQLRYNLFVQQVSHEARMLRTGINGSGQG
ncbi:flagellar basal body rod protein FlgB [Paenibacillus abyssi]|uniref:Flagellar basal body rod protein FlgB n=1 Tax=Paenibacillus abyssi TaxID=1340531 RepID=A0A917D897_9BACL|nr:flagellar basal body rod protein FlgB [Paenibacillus abyssi]GGG12440.1 flagellar basal body rod protein FlgB [Paenibacillus abyssi]